MGTAAIHNKVSLHQSTMSSSYISYDLNIALQMQRLNRKIIFNIFWHGPESTRLKPQYSMFSEHATTGLEQAQVYNTRHSTSSEDGHDMMAETLAKKTWARRHPVILEKPRKPTTSHHTIPCFYLNSTFVPCEPLLNWLFDNSFTITEARS